tara:strand:- start:394 stop:687 length:294 start_codon:yes stop_codon:yes gene_type:complete
MIIGSKKIVTDTEQLMNAPYGMQGADVITNTTTYQGEWYCIMSIEDNTTLNMSDTKVNWQQNRTAFSSNLDLITGVPYYGNFTTLKLVDGKIIAYNK